MAKLFITLVVSTILAVSSTLPATDNKIGAYGYPAENFEFPYTVLFTARNVPQCHGSIIDVNGTQLIVTSAQCLVGVALSSYRVTNRNEERFVKRIVAHEDYDIPAHTYNIALVWLDKPFTYDNYTAPIALPAQGQETTGDVILSAEVMKSSGTYQVVQTPIVSNEECQTAWPSYEILPHMICAGPLSLEACDPVGGSIRAVEGDYLVGLPILRSTYSCRNPIYPFVNTKVSHFVDWIHSFV